MKNYKSAFHPNMEKIPNIFRRLPVQVWYFLAAPLFFMAFLLVYCPFDSKSFLDAGRGLFYFNVSILFSILFVTLVITRLAFHFIFRGRQLALFGYIGWCMAEMLLAAAFMAIFMSLISQPHLPYFGSLGRCARLSFLILSYPYAIITLSLFLAARAEDTELKQDKMLRFTDENMKLKLVVASSSVVYLAAEENYVRIHYVEGLKLKDYALRNSMKTLESLCEGKGLVRCHRSYIINPSHVKALSKGKEGLIEAEMDVDCPPIPVSKRMYDNLSSLL